MFQTGEYFKVNDDIEFKINKYTNINNIIIKEGIEVIEDGETFDFGDSMFAEGGAFLGVGVIHDNLGDDLEGFDSFALDLSFPSTLSYIGKNAFALTPISELRIPLNVKYIGKYAFIGNFNLTSLFFDGAKDDKSKLEFIGEEAFSNCDLTYDGTTEEKYLQIPSSVQVIEEGAFCYSENLKFISFNGTSDQLDKLNNEWWYDDNITTVQALEK